jgi:N-acetylmuramic acid 6-phosphate etherase
MRQTTEDAVERFRGLDRWSTSDVVTALWNGQMQAVASCLPALSDLATAVDAAAARLAAGQGRLIHVGAGSSGLIALLDSAELFGTFAWPDQRRLVILAGGLDLTDGLRSDTEDDEGLGRQRIIDHGVGSADVVIGVSASGNSVFTSGALDQAARQGALTIGLTSMPQSALARVALHTLVTETGAEVVAGSTRLGAGTAQKVVLNLFSTALMTRLGCVYDNLMINVRPDNAKLAQRCIAIVGQVAGVDQADAAKALQRHGDIKRAVLALAGVPECELSPLLAETANNLRTALTLAASRGWCPDGNA